MSPRFDLMKPEDVWIGTFTGKRFFPFQPRVHDVDIADIGHALARICRYTGHTHDFYSVAQHCVEVSKMVAPEHQFAALLHDASEAYLVDVPRPMKPHFPGYAHRELVLEETIAAHFGLKYPWHPTIKAADAEILRREILWLFPNHPDLHERWGIRPEDREKTVPLFGWAPHAAESAFFERYEELSRWRHT